MLHMWPVFTVEFMQKSKKLIPKIISASWKLFSEPCGICFFGNFFSLCDFFIRTLEKLYSLFLISPHWWEKLQKIFPRQDGRFIMKLGHCRKILKSYLNFEVPCNPKKMWTHESAQIFHSAVCSSLFGIIFFPV